MRTIRLKGKHIIYTIVFTVAALLIVYLAVGPPLLMHYAEKLAGSGRVKDAQAVYDRVAELFPYSSAAPIALYHSAGYNTPSHYRLGSRFEEAGVVYIFPDFSSSFHGKQLSKTDAQSAIKKYKKLTQRYPASPWAEHGLKQLAAVYHYLEDYEKAEHYLMEYINRSRHSAAEGYLMLAELYREQEKNGQALDAVETLLSEYPGNYALDAALLKGEILVDMGRLDEAEAIARRIPEMAREEYSDLNDYMGPDVRTDNVDLWVNRTDRLTAMIEAARDNPDYGGRISGTITKGDSPFEGVYVYVQSKIYSNVSQSPPDYIAKARTGKDGRFSIEGLLPGHYQVGLGVPAHLLEGYTLEKKDAMSMISVDREKEAIIDLRFVETLELISPTGGEQVDLGEITFTWEEVPGAKTYTLYVGPVTINDKGVISSYSFAPLVTGITQNSITLSMEDFDLRRPLTVSYDEKGVSPEVVLGLLYPGGTFTWGVYAYDENGSEITTSRGYGASYTQRDLPLVSVAGKITNKGDRLLMERKYAEAISFYEETLESSPNDIHSLSALAKLNHYGMNKTREDYLKAAGYYRRILDIADAPELRESLAEVLFEAGDYKEALAEYKRIEPQLVSWLTHYKIGQCLFLTGRVDDAFENFDRAALMENGKYMRGYPVAAAIAGNRIDKALEYAALVDEGGLYLDDLQEYANKGYFVDGRIVSLVESGDLEGAINSLDDTETFGLFFKGLLYRLTGDYSKAEDVLLSLRRVTTDESALLTPILQKILGR
jgi:tetratricopeptide (TPR) repeat protein